MAAEKEAKASDSAAGQEKDLREIVTDELNRVSTGGPWVW